jgi:thioester reductase-like protein
MTGIFLFGGTITLAALVTGGTGFLGSRLVCELLAQGEHVYALVRGNKEQSPHDRLVGVLSAIGAPPAILSAAAERLIVLDGDISHPELGLDRFAYDTLSAEIEAIWHSAALTSLQGNLARLKTVNVNGTAHILKLGSTSKKAHIYHVSTAFVVGASQDTVTEGWFDEPGRFETNYEASKNAAERLVREWVRDTSASATIFRPSILITDRDQSSKAPPHTIQQLVNMVQPLLKGRSRVSLRIPGDPEGRLNFMPVEDAAKAMVRVAESDRGISDGAVRTYNVVHPTEIRVSDLMSAFEEILQVNCTIVSAPSAQPTGFEKFLYRALPGFLPYLNHKRHYAPGRLAQVGISNQEIDRAYLVRSMRVRPVALGARESRPASHNAIEEAG